MTSDPISRTQRGVTAGGQFSIRGRTDGNVVLDVDDIAASKSPDISLSELSRLARHTDARIRANVALNINLPTDAIRELSLDKDYGVRYFLASNPRLRGTVVEHLTHDPNATIRLAALRHENLPLHAQQGVMNRLVESELYSLASNLGANVSFLDKLGRDVSPMVRGAVAANSSARPSVLVELLSDSDSRVRAFAAMNPSTPSLSADI